MKTFTAIALVAAGLVAETARAASPAPPGPVIHSRQPVPGRVGAPMQITVAFSEDRTDLADLAERRMMLYGVPSQLYSIEMPSNLASGCARDTIRGSNGPSSYMDVTAFGVTNRFDRTRRLP